MNSFDNFVLTGSNMARYIPIKCNAKCMVGSYRKVKESIRLGQVPLFLLDGNLSDKVFKTSIKKMNLKKYVVIYRNFDLSIKDNFNDLYNKNKSIALVDDTWELSDWAKEEMQLYEKISKDISRNESDRECALSLLKPYINYENIKQAYLTATKTSPVDIDIEEVIKSDLNEYLYNRAEKMFSYGIESILDNNKKQSKVPKHKYFMNGLKNIQVNTKANSPALKGISQINIDATINKLRYFCIHQTSTEGMIKLTDILIYCSEIGLYRGDIILYILGSVMQDFNKDNVVFYDGVCYWKYKEIRDLSPYFLKLYDTLHSGIECRYELNSMLYFDKTTLKYKLLWIFGLDISSDDRLDTLGSAIIQVSVWITENLRYPISFLDNTLYKLLSDCELYGDNLLRYNNYFTKERCQELNAKLTQADNLARTIIENKVGFDPDVTEHKLSNLPKGHWGVVLYSIDEWVEHMLKKYPWEK